MNIGTIIGFGILVMAGAITYWLIDRKNKKEVIKYGKDKIQRPGKYESGGDEESDTTATGTAKPDTDPKSDGGERDIQANSDTGSKQSQSASESDEPDSGGEDEEDDIAIPDAE